MTTTIDEYKALLKAHDWTFEFSERSSVFQRGIEQKRTLQMIQPKLDPDYTIWNQFAPDFAKAR